MLYSPFVSYFANVLCLPTPTFCQSSNAWLSKMLIASWKVMRLLHVCGIPWDFPLAVRWQFLSKGFCSCYVSWVSHLAGAILPARCSAYGSCTALQSCCSNLKVYDPSVPFHTHKQDIPILSLLWLGAEPPPGKHMVGCIHSAPLLGISHKPRFWTSWLDGAMALNMANLWSLITVTFLFTDINSFHTHLTHSTNYEPSCC